MMKQNKMRTCCKKLVSSIKMKRITKKLLKKRLKQFKRFYNTLLVILLLSLVWEYDSNLLAFILVLLVLKYSLRLLERFVIPKFQKANKNLLTIVETILILLKILLTILQKILQKTNNY